LRRAVPAAAASRSTGQQSSILLTRIGKVAYGDGYIMVASDGGIFDFSSKPFLGSLGANPPANPIVGVAVVG
jgi:hypothetical protein